MKTLILGGARSGKSAYAEQLAARQPHPVTVIATAEAHDAEMAARIAHHRQQRPAHWLTVEEPLALAAALRQHARPDGLILVDCLTLWLTNQLLAADLPEDGPLSPPAQWLAAREALLCTLETLPGEVLLIANEVGLGIVPLGALNRLFVDEAGRLNQALAARCQQVRFIAAGLPMTLKG